jgi:hypothetical protein
VSEYVTPSDYIVVDTIELGPRSGITTILNPPGERRAGCLLRLEQRRGDEDWSRRFDTWLPISKLPSLIESLIEAEKKAIDFGWLTEPVNAGASEGGAL